MAFVYIELKFSLSLQTFSKPTRLAVAKEEREWDGTQRGAVFSGSSGVGARQLL
jgi:hypothetical protein